MDTAVLLYQYFVASFWYFDINLDPPSCDILLIRHFECLKIIYKIQKFSFPFTYCFRYSQEQTKLIIYKFMNQNRAVHKVPLKSCQALELLQLNYYFELHVCLPFCMYTNNWICAYASAQNSKHVLTLRTASLWHYDW